MNVTVSSASKYEQSAAEAPATVTVITADEIRKYGYRTLAEILRSVVGFYTSYDRNYSYLGIRGFARPGDYNTRFLFLVDGHRINDSVDDYAAMGTDFILDVDLIDSVEIVRGPSFSLYGNNAFLGIVNVNTKNGKDVRGPEMSGAGGSNKTFTGRLTYGNAFTNGLDMILSGSLYDSEGQKSLYFKEFDDPATNNGIAHSIDDDKNYSFFSKALFHEFSLEGAYLSREKRVPTASFDTIFNDPRTKTHDERAYVDLKCEHTFDNQVNAMARLSYDHYFYHGDYIYDYPPITLNKDSAHSEWVGAELRLLRTVLEKHTVILGTEYTYNVQQDQRVYDEDPYAEYLNDQRDSRVWAIYAQDEFRILQPLILNAGVRYDHYSTFGDTTNPRIALIYRPFETTTLKLLYGTAFRAPNAYELYYNDGPTTMKANPDLRPESISDYEGILEQSLGDHLRATAVGFYYTIDDLISQTIDPSDGLQVFKNADEAEVKGAELGVEGQWAGGVKGRASYTYSDAEDKKTGSVLTNSPRHLAKFNLIVPVIKETLFLGLEEQYTGTRKTLAGTGAAGFLVTNVTLFSQDLIKGLDLSGSVYNLFDESYGDPGAADHLQDTIPQDGRTFRVKFSYRYNSGSWW